MVNDDNFFVNDLRDIKQGNEGVIVGSYKIKENVKKSDNKKEYKLYSESKYNGKKISLIIKAGLIILLTGTIVVSLNFINIPGLTNEKIDEISNHNSDLEEELESVGEKKDLDSHSNIMDEYNREKSKKSGVNDYVKEDSEVYKSYDVIDGEYDKIIDYFNTFVDGQIYQIGTTFEVNESIKDFLYNTEAGQYIQYYSNEFGVDPKISVAIAAGESSLLHEMNDGAATGLFGLEKGIKDQFWVYDYDVQKYVLINIDPDENYDLKTNIRNGIAILAYKYSIDGNIYNGLFRYNVGNYGFDYMLNENNYLINSINDRGWRYYTDDYCSRHKLGTPNYIDNIGKCLYDDTFTMKCRDVEITMEYSTGKIISITKIPDYNYDEGSSFNDIIDQFTGNKSKVS